MYFSHPQLRDDGLVVLASAQASTILARNA
jgi:hypothetical protein